MRLHTAKCLLTFHAYDPPVSAVLSGCSIVSLLTSGCERTLDSPPSGRRPGLQRSHMAKAANGSSSST